MDASSCSLSLTEMPILGSASSESTSLNACIVAVPAFMATPFQAEAARVHD